MSYRCNRCRNPKLKKVRARICQIATEQKLTRMATLTLDPKSVPGKFRGRTDRYIRECWRELRNSLSREYGKDLPFIGVLEFQENKAAHLHVLFGRYIPQAWLSGRWESVGGGRVVDIRYVEVHRVSAYLAVYLAGGKVIRTLELLPKRARIFTTSRSVVLWGKKQKSGWWLRRVGLSELYDAIEKPENVRFDAVDDLKAFRLELLSYFESPPSQEAIGNRNVIDVLKEAITLWKAGIS